jgi:hypothetical protein
VRPFHHGGCTVRADVGKDATHSFFRADAFTEKRDKPIEQGGGDVDFIPRCTM